eukprot:CAMPEP_0117831592 /NCGR_PEP_ID=MMETSP0949-20121206/9189_1 /TAXON_ID=44440 /ORGANISM="Chattonella subsalsa, Strain CCMP2191" /LENGTH=568 /DNA_ID=CAMNT_0005672835 /DNA_START=208 /DNA_END=1914 /DNA_ORIENTATION=-
MMKSEPEMINLLRDLRDIFENRITHYSAKLNGFYEYEHNTTLDKLNNVGSSIEDQNKDMKVDGQGKTDNPAEVKPALENNEKAEDTTGKEDSSEPYTNGVAEKAAEEAGDGKETNASNNASQPPEVKAPEVPINIDTSTAQEAKEGKEAEESDTMASKATEAEENQENTMSVDGGVEESKLSEVMEEEKEEKSSTSAKKKRKAPTSSPVPVIKDDEDQPISFSLYGRKRKSVERMKTVESFTKEEVDIEAGKGLALQDIEKVAANIKKENKTSLVLKYLHQLCFGKVPKQATVKQNILGFSGIVYPPGEEEFYRAKSVEKGLKFPLKTVKDMLDLLDVPRGKAVFGEVAITKDKLINILVDFLEQPAESAKPKKVVKKTEKAKTPKKSTTPKRKKKEKEEGPVKKKAKTTSKKKPKKDSSKKEKAKKKKLGIQVASPDQNPKNTTKPKASSVDKEMKKYFSSDSEDDNESAPLSKKVDVSDDEDMPLSEKFKKKEEDSDGVSSDSDDEVSITNDQLKKHMGQLLSSGNFEELTLKKIRENLEDHFGVNLEERKDDLRKMLEECIQEMS